MATADSTTETVFSTSVSGPPALRFLHYNDVYHILPDATTNVGGAPRFATLLHQYRDASDSPAGLTQAESLPSLLTFFSGDAFNPSLESTITRGKHMVPVLNALKTDVACLGNHDLDFGVETFTFLKEKCEFPWLCANILDPALLSPEEEQEGLIKGKPLGGCKDWIMLESKTPGGETVKVGVVGVGEKEWLDTVNMVPPNLVFVEPSVKVEEASKVLKEQGAEVIVVVSHMREPNDVKLAESVQKGTVDLILGGHDHHYAHQLINGTHILRSGCDFKNLSYIELHRSASGGWDFNITRRNLRTSIPEHKETRELVDKLTSGPSRKLKTPIGTTLCPLDAKFVTVRARESNLGNFVTDLMRYYYHGDLGLMPAGTIRGDCVYPRGKLTLGDMVNCFPFEDPVVVVRLTGRKVWEALENGVSKVPALEGRYPQVSGMKFVYDSREEEGKRVKAVLVDGDEIDLDKWYTMVTRGYVARGKDGYDGLEIKEGNDQVEWIVDEEGGVLISMIIRQYFLGIKTLGQWKTKRRESVGEDGRPEPVGKERRFHHKVPGQSDAKKFFAELKRKFTHDGKLERRHDGHGEVSDSGSDSGEDSDDREEPDSPDDDERDEDEFNAREKEVADQLDEEEKAKAAKVAQQWGAVAKHGGDDHDILTEKEKSVASKFGKKWRGSTKWDWTRGIRPMLEGRIVDLAEHVKKELE
ncbi:Metallo-dependent phosphatase [Ascobolus immersus RN42]|uniref:Metallo-dependent phosphatase n=1 Tax=Ascobolus immersus RN42 TaxID=1160509 RepID=A0A3N4HU40_ASCIM|nr:Metallo-dependent phosphatase [Ascobolus immersus RN42]